MNEVTSVPPGAKKRDYWWTVFFTDPIALPLVRLLARRKWFTPDQISVVALIMGLAVGPVFALGTRTALVAGGVLFYVTFVVDCIDGKLARALEITSPRGAALDRISDGARRASASLGLIVWLWRAEDVGNTAFWWGVVYAIAAYFFLELSGVEKPIEKTTRAFGPGDERPGLAGRWASALARRRLLPIPGMPDVQAVAFIIGPVTGLVVQALAVGTAMVLVGILVSVYRRTR
ncbi:MAG: CDP-alcohol phosphatidyltransferase family protein [Actinomycetota bacterium]